MSDVAIAVVLLCNRRELDWTAIGTMELVVDAFHFENVASSELWHLFVCYPKGFDETTVFCISWGTQWLSSGIADLSYVKPEIKLACASGRYLCRRSWKSIARCIKPDSGRINRIWWLSGLQSVLLHVFRQLKGPRGFHPCRPKQQNWKSTTIVSFDNGGHFAWA